MTRTQRLQVKTNVRAGEVTVYGKPSCGWTKKQLDHLNESGTEHTFVDCSDEAKCPSIVKGYPTTVITGFTKF